MTTVRWRWVPLRDRALSRTDDVTKVLHKRAELAAEFARFDAPVDSGFYRDSIEAEEDRLVSHAWYAHFIEWGTRDTPAHATLRNAARHAADRVVDA